MWLSRNWIIQQQSFPVAEATVSVNPWLKQVPQAGLKDICTVPE